MAGDLNWPETFRGEPGDALCHPYWVGDPAQEASHPRFACFPPPSELRDSIEFFWKLDRTGSRGPIGEMVAPGGDTDLIYGLGEGGQSLVRGPQTRVTLISITAASYLGVRLRTGVAPRVTGLSAADLLDRRIPEAPIDAAVADALCDAAGAREHKRIFAALADLLRKRLRGGEGFTESSVASFAVRMIQASGGTLPVRDVARQVGCSARHLRRTLVAATGLSPKEYARIVRFRHAMHLVARTRRPFAEIALGLGYSDQAHMTREFAAVADRTPLALRRILSARAVSGHTTSVRAMSVHAMSAFDKKSAPPQR